VKTTSWDFGSKHCGTSAGALDNCFDFYNWNVDTGKDLVFTLLKSTTGLEKGTSLTAYTTETPATELGESTSFNLGWNTWCVIDCDTPVTPTPSPKEKWYQTKPVVITASVGASFATIAVLLLIW